MEQITILMSTYNGEKFLREQLDSIFNQNDVVVNLCVRDDGSSDNTINILLEYKKNYGDQIKIIEGHNIGWKKSFFALIQFASEHYQKCNYFAFSDQDDIWLPDKLFCATQFLQKLPEGANLYCSNQYRYKADINIGEAWNTTPDKSPIKSILRNCATGCTIVMNKNLVDLISDSMPSIELAHDYWAFLSATFCGNVILDAHAHILYRQHENNQIGSKTGLINRWKRRIKNIKVILKSHEREALARELLRCYGDHIPQELRLQLKNIANYKANFHNRIKLCNDKTFRFGLKANDFWLRIKILLGIL